MIRGKDEAIKMRTFLEIRGLRGEEVYFGRRKTLGKEHGKIM
jgi:hypothetical protein